MIGTKHRTPPLPNNKKDRKRSTLVWKLDQKLARRIATAKRESASEIKK
jgi:hypothetical protein